MPKINKREAELKALTLIELEIFGKEFEVIQVQDVRKPGTPDINVNGHHRSTWWEFKHATPDFETYGLQEIKCQRLARTSYCRYVIFYDGEYDNAKSQRMTFIVHPKFVANKDGKIDWNTVDYVDNNMVDLIVSGHDHFAVATHMRKVHKQNHEHLD